MEKIDEVLTWAEARKDKFAVGSLERKTIEQTISSARKWHALKSSPQSKENDQAMVECLKEIQNGVTLWSELGKDSTAVQSVLDDALKNRPHDNAQDYPAD